MRMAATTAWWQATRSRARAAGRMREENSWRRRKRRCRSRREAVALIGVLFAVEKQAKEISQQVAGMRRFDVLLGIGQPATRFAQQAHLRFGQHAAAFRGLALQP